MENLLTDIPIISNVLATGNSVAINHAEHGEIIIRLGITGDKEKQYMNGFGLKHIVVRRSLEGKNEAEIAAILALIPETLRVGETIQNTTRVSTEGLDTGQIKLEKNGIMAVVRKTYFDNREKWLLTGFDNHEKQESSDAIRTVIARYSYSPVFSCFRKQVGAELLVEQGINPTHTKSVQQPHRKVKRDFSIER